MARLPLERILDANGDPVSGARAYIFMAGTTNAVTPYSDTGLTTPHGAFVSSNSAGEWPDAYVAAGSYKIRYTDADQAVLYEQDHVLAQDAEITPEAKGFTFTDGAYVVYVSPSGLSGNDGTSAAAPMDFVTGFNTLRSLVALFPHEQWRMQFAAGTYLDVGARRFENFPATTYPVQFFGVEDLGVPTVIFDNWADRVFAKFNDAIGVNVHFKDLKFTDFASDAILLHHGASVISENLHASNMANTAFQYRGAAVVHEGGVIENSGGGVSMQDVYGEVNDVTFNGVTRTDGLGYCVEISRGSKCYIRRCSFGETTACDVHISQSRFSRIRTQSNVFGAFNTNSIWQQSASVWNDDLDNPDDFSGVGAAVGDSVVRAEPGCFTTRFHGGLHRLPHRFMTAPSVTLTGTSRTLMDGRLAPFRMPAFWMFSETATGVVEYEVKFPVAETVDFQINGEADSNQTFASLSITATEASSWLLRFEVTGPRAGDGLQTGTYIARAFGSYSGAEATKFGSTASFSLSAMARNSVEQLVTRFYVTRSDGTGDLEFLRMNSWATF